MKKYLVIMTINNVNGAFYDYVTTTKGKEKAGEMAINKFKNEFPIYKDDEINIYNTIEQ